MRLWHFEGPEQGVPGRFPTFKGVHVVVAENQWNIIWSCEQITDFPTLERCCQSGSFGSFYNASINWSQLNSSPNECFNTDKSNKHNIYPSCTLTVEVGQTFSVLMQTWQDFWPQKEGAVYETQMLGSVFIFQWIYRTINYWRITACLFCRYHLKELPSVLNIISSDIYENNSKIFKRMASFKSLGTL